MRRRFAGHRDRVGDELRWPMVLVLGALSAFGPIAIDVYLPSLPAIAGDLHTATGNVELTLTACTLGLGAGQLVMGPLSDAWGRRRLLLAGLCCFTVFSVGCAFSPTLWALVVCRFVQALGGSAGLVLCRAIARDLRRGRELARLFAVLLVVNGTAPVIAPVLGGQLVRVTSWRGVFAALALIGLLLLALTAILIPETLGAAKLSSGEQMASSAGHLLSVSMRSYRSLLHDRTFVLAVLVGAFGFATLFTYISASPFVLEQHYGLSPQGFSLVFAANSIGIVALGLVVRTSATRAILVGSSISAAGAVGALGVITTHTRVAWLLIALFFAAGGFGAIAPNIAALGLEHHASSAGAASALLGAAQFVLGGAIGPALSGHAEQALTMGVVMSGCAVVTLVLSIRLVRAPETTAKMP